MNFDDKWLLNNNFQLMVDYGGGHKHFLHYCGYIGVDYHKPNYYLTYIPPTETSFQCCIPPPKTVREIEFMIEMVQRVHNEMQELQQSCVQS